MLSLSLDSLFIRNRASFHLPRLEWRFALSRKSKGLNILMSNLSIALSIEINSADRSAMHVATSPVLEVSLRAIVWFRA